MLLQVEAVLGDQRRNIGPFVLRALDELVAERIGRRHSLHVSNELLCRIIGKLLLDDLLSQGFFLGCLLFFSLLLHALALLHCVFYFAIHYLLFIFSL